MILFVEEIFTASSWFIATSSTLVLALGIQGGSTVCKYGIPIGGDGNVKSIHGGEILS